MDEKTDKPSDLSERKCMGQVLCENCGGECAVYEAPKSGRLSYTCVTCGSQFMARTQESMRRLMDRVRRKHKKEVNSDQETNEQKRTGTGEGVFDWNW